MKSSKFQVLLYYQYIEIDDPKKFLEDHKALCTSLNLKGRIIIAKEGINGTVEGTLENTEKYIVQFVKDPKFSDTHFKKSASDGKTFPKLSIKIRGEIVSSYFGNKLNPRHVSGKYITPEELHNWIHSRKKFYSERSEDQTRKKFYSERSEDQNSRREPKRFYIVDMRNDYEQAVGYFQNSLLAPFKNFRDLPKVLPVLENLKEETIISVCTGGVRCEKASGFLVENGFKDVYQLFGGIVSYMEKYPNEDFLGKLYVFDGRVTIGFNIEDPKHTVVGVCKFCSGPAENYYDCKNIHCKRKRHFISCNSCIEKDNGYCSMECKQANGYLEYRKVLLL